MNIALSNNKQANNELTGRVRRKSSASPKVVISHPERPEEPLLSPSEVLAQLPAGMEQTQLVEQSRETINNILSGKDPRLLVVVGPCSIHDYQSALEYAARLKQLSLEVSDKLYLVMRGYFEKPRTTVGWKGLITDPHLDDSCDIGYGVKLTRRILLGITALGLPVATEALDPNLVHYYQDLVSWVAIGARTAESQLHRQLASGMASPVGIKNATNGCIDTAVNAVMAARASHTYVGMNCSGNISVVKTRGNEAGHLILRGGQSGPNYDEYSIRLSKQKLKQAGLDSKIVIDCSHGNSGKDAQQQKQVLMDIMRQLARGEDGVAGVMIESHLKAGQQSIKADPAALDYGVSITDDCIGWDDTETMLRELAVAIPG